MVKSRICPICHRELQPVEVNVLGQKRFMPVSCECEVKQMVEAQKASEQEQKNRKVNEIFHQSRLGPKLTNATFKNFEQLPGTLMALKESVRFVKERHWQTGEGLLIYGVPGNGKSHLAAAIYNSVVLSGVMALFLNVPELIKKIKSTYSGKDRYCEEEILYWISESDVVVLDDLGAERLTESSHETIYVIINALYSRGKSLIVTANLDFETKFREHVGERIYDRILEMCRLVENKGWSYRRRIAERRLAAESEG